MIRVVAREKIQSGKKEEVLPILKELIEATRKEAGCISYTLNELIDEPNVVAVLEIWESKEALEAHMASEHFRRLIPQISGFMAEPTRIEVFFEII